MKKAIVILSIIIVALVGALAGCIFRINTLTTTKTLSSLNYSVGAISTETGENEESKNSIYLKKSYKLDGASILISEDATITYQMFYYDEDGNYLGSSEVLTEDYDSSLDLEGATEFRLVITPVVEDGEEAVEISKVSTYSKQLTVVVSR